LARDRKYAGTPAERARQRSKAAYNKKMGYPYKIVKGKVITTTKDDPDAILPMARAPGVITTEILELPDIEIIQKYKTEDWPANVVVAVIKEKWDREKATVEAKKHPMAEIELPKKFEKRFRKLIDDLARHTTKTNPKLMDELKPK